MRAGWCLVVLATLVAACDPSATVCRRAARCNGSDADQCVEDTQELKREAREAGCMPEYNDLAACTLDNGECNDEGVWVSSGCAQEGIDIGVCLLEAAF